MRCLKDHRPSCRISGQPSVSPYPSSVEEVISGELLVVDPIDCPPAELPSSRVESVWAEYSEMSVSPLLASESVAKGLRVEKLEDIPGLKAAMESKSDA